MTVDDIPDPLPNVKEPAEAKMAPLSTVAHAAASLKMFQLQELNQQVEYSLRGVEVYREGVIPKLIISPSINIELYLIIIFTVKC